MTFGFTRLGRIAGVAVTALTFAGGLAGTASAATFTGRDAQARALTPAPAVSGKPMCLDAGSPPRRNNGLVTLWMCEAGNANQAWVIDGGQLKVKDTIATTTPMCLDAGRPPRRNGGLLTLWKCQTGNANQAWVIDGGQVKVKDTLS